MSTRLWSTTQPSANRTEQAGRGLLDRRLIFLLGKGGVGRSTLAAALGVLAARSGRRAIVVEVSGRGDVPRLFGAQFSIEPFSGWSLGVNRLLQYGGGAPSLSVADEPGEPAADAVLKGGCEAMMALLEARVDGDALFFTRELTVSGDTALPSWKRM